MLPTGIKVAAECLIKSRSFPPFSKHLRETEPIFQDLLPLVCKNATSYGGHMLLSLASCPSL